MKFLFASTQNKVHIWILNFNKNNNYRIGLCPLCYTMTTDFTCQSLDVKAALLEAAFHKLMSVGAFSCEKHNKFT